MYLSKNSLLQYARNAVALQDFCVLCCNCLRDLNVAKTACIKAKRDKMVFFILSVLTLAGSLFMLTYSFENPDRLLWLLVLLFAGLFISVFTALKKETDVKNLSEKIAEVTEKLREYENRKANYYKELVDAGNRYSENKGFIDLLDFDGGALISRSKDILGVLEQGQAASLLDATELIVESSHEVQSDAGVLDCCIRQLAELGKK